MHEVGIMQDAVIMAEKQARESGGSRIHRLSLRIGTLSGVVPDALQFAFEVVTQGTMAEGAELQIESISAVCWCAKCQLEFECGEFWYECPHCHELSNDLRRGRELQIASIEIS